VLPQHSRDFLGQWAFIEIADPWDAQKAIRGRLAGME